MLCKPLVTPLTLASAGRSRSSRTGAAWLPSRSRASAIASRSGIARSTTTGSGCCTGACSCAVTALEALLTSNTHVQVPQGRVLPPHGAAQRPLRARVPRPAYVLCQFGMFDIVTNLSRIFHLSLLSMRCCRMRCAVRTRAFVQHVEPFALYACRRFEVHLLLHLSKPRSFPTEWLCCLDPCRTMRTAARCSTTCARSTLSQAHRRPWRARATFNSLKRVATLPRRSCDLSRKSCDAPPPNSGPKSLGMLVGMLTYICQDGELALVTVQGQRAASGAPSLSEPQLLLSCTSAERNLAWSAVRCT